MTIPHWAKNPMPSYATGGPVRPRVQRFRSKIVQVEAILFDGTNGEEVAQWCGGEYLEDAKASDPTDIYKYVNFPTLSGVSVARVNSYVIREADGRLRTEEKAKFEESYEIPMRIRGAGVVGDLGQDQLR